MDASNAIAAAVQVAPLVDGILVDSGNRGAPVKELGAPADIMTGRSVGAFGRP